MCLELLISISFKILLCVLVFMFFQPRSFYFYRACVCVFVPGFHHPAGHLWSLAWIPCCSICRSDFPVRVPLPGKADGSTSVRTAGSEEAPFGVQTSALAVLVFLGQVCSNPLEKHSKALCSFPFTLYHYLHFLCSRHWRKPFIYLRYPPPNPLCLRACVHFPSLLPF